MDQKVFAVIEKSLAEIKSAKNCERILHDLLAELVKLLDLHVAAIVELNPDTEQLEIRNFHNLSWNFCKNYRRQIDSQLLREVIWKNQDINIPEKKHAQKVVDHLQMEHDFVSAFVTSLNAFQQPLGFLYVDSLTLNYFNEERQQIVRIYASLISIVLHLERLN
ncbi:MAG TPA: GAF domain-containing protein, partial [Caldithrix abyssi]|nr:GAF domain-containing protein [Caldithrix abyssi]